MDRLLVLLFSVTLLLATSAPRVSTEARDCSGGVGMEKKTCSVFALFCTPDQEGDSDCSKDSDCKFPICCVCGPCCCLCIVPECPVLYIAPALPEVQNLKPSGYQVFFPQQVCFSIWKPPAFSV
jgi:hypothetical protein